MNAERLLALYEKVAEAPDAVPRLRRFVLDLAVRGKLVEQDPSDASPVKLVAKARKELRAQAETAKRMRWKQTDPVAKDEIDKDVPSGWVAARVNDTGLYINGLAFKPADWKQSGIPIIRIQNLTDPQKEFNYAEGDFPDEVMVRDGDLLVSWSATLEAFKWDRGEGVLNQHIFRVIPHEGLTDRGFLLLLLRHAIREMADSEHAHGLVMTHINRGPFLNHVVLIPPLAEQRQIVAKVEELMALLDRLEAARTAREATRDRLSAASLARLTAPDTEPAEFPANARFALATLPALTTRPDQIKPLRQTILNLAVRGKLVEQDPADEPASELLKRIAAERGRLVREGAIRAKKQPTRLEEDELPFEAPSGWRWTRLAQAFVVTGGIQKTPARAPKENAFPYLGVGNVYRNRIDLSNLKQFELQNGELEKFGLKPFDIMLVEGNGSASEIGRCAMWEGQIEDCVHQNHLIRCRPIEPDLSPYAMLYLNSPLGMDEMRDLAITSAGLYNLSVGKISKIAIPLPPLAEQHRIAAKVDALMALCDRLEAALTTADTTRARLLEALLHEALEPAAEAVTEAAE